MYFFITVFLILTFVNSSLFLVARAEIELSSSLPKTKDTGTSLEVEANESDKNDEEMNDLEEEKKVNPTKIYKLIAIYLIDKQPRALIKNLTLPDEAAHEYQVGEYLDDLQLLSVSKILLNPTFRIEIVDQDGLAYLLKPSEINSKETSTTKTNYGTKSTPTYFSSGSKYKPRKTLPKEEEKPASLEATIKKEENVPEPSALPVPQAQQAIQATPSAPAATTPPSTSLQAVGSGTSYTSSTSSTSTMIDSKASPSPSATDPSSRPVDPFSK